MNRKYKITLPNYTKKQEEILEQCFHEMVKNESILTEHPFAEIETNSRCENLISEKFIVKSKGEVCWFAAVGQIAWSEKNPRKKKITLTPEGAFLLYVLKPFLREGIDFFGKDN